MNQKELIEKHLRLVPFIIRRYIRPVSGISEEDMIAVGYLALWKAALKYNPDYGIKFSTYGSTAIRNEILRMIRDDDKQIKAVSLDIEAHDDRGRPLGVLVDAIPSQDKTPDKILEAREEIKNLYCALEKLSEQDVEVLCKSYGLGSMEPQQHKDLAAKFGISRSAVSMRIRSARHRLKTAMLEVDQIRDEDN